MATQGYFTLKGLEGYLEELARVSEDIDQPVQEVLIEAALDVEEEMQNLVPIDTGNLHNHIQIDGPHQEGNFSYVTVGVIHDISHTDAETAIYGNVMEYGSARVAARPYIRPALKKKKSVIKEALKKILARFGLST